MNQESICKERFDETMEQLNQFMDSHNFPPEMRQRLIGFYMLKFPTKRQCHLYLCCMCSIGDFALRGSMLAFHVALRLAGA